MEAIHLDAKVKAALDSFDWSNIEERPVNNNLSCCGLLHQVYKTVKFVLLLLS